MTAGGDRLEGLRRIAALHRERDLRDLAVAARRLKAARDGRERIEAELTRLDQVALAADNAALAGQSAEHGARLLRRRHEAAAELARAQADLHSARERAARSFGRSLALDRLHLPRKA
ncbi:hypothetical protein [Albidovulum sp.]